MVDSSETFDLYAYLLQKQGVVTSPVTTAYGFPYVGLFFEQGSRRLYFDHAKIRVLANSLSMPGNSEDDEAKATLEREVARHIAAQQTPAEYPVVYDDSTFGYGAYRGIFTVQVFGSAYGNPHDFHTQIPATTRMDVLDRLYAVAMHHLEIITSEAFNQILAAGGNVEELFRSP